MSRLKTTRVKHPRHKTRKRRKRVMLHLRRRSRLSKNARQDTPLARAYREAKAAYRKAGQALRRSCSSKSRQCGLPPRFKMKRQRFRFIARNVGSMKHDFLTAPSDTGTNEDIIRHAIGHMNVRDKTQWEPIAEKYEKKGIETFDQAFDVLAKAAKRDWRKFDIEALRESPGMASIELPAFMHEAKSQEEAERHYEEAPF